jgi:type VI secretion system secreted protein VgrG
MGSSDWSARLADFASAFGQHNRLLSLHFGGAGPSADTLLPLKLTGQEQISHNYRYQLDCLAANAALELKTLLGLPVQVGILNSDGARRPLTGLVTAVHAPPSNGGFAGYRLIIEPGLALLSLRAPAGCSNPKPCPTSSKRAEHQALNPILAQSLRLEAQLSKSHPERSAAALSVSHAQLHAQDGDVKIAGDKNARLYQTRKSCSWRLGRNCC